jgi:hypothetical protein
MWSSCYGHRHLRSCWNVRWNQCCGSGMFYLGSRIRNRQFSHTGSCIKSGMQTYFFLCSSAFRSKVLVLVIVKKIRKTFIPDPRVKAQDPGTMVGTMINSFLDGAFRTLFRWEIRWKKVLKPPRNWHGMWWITGSLQRKNCGRDSLLFSLGFNKSANFFQYK